MTSTDSGEWVVVWGCVSLTLQLLRLSIDLVQTASPPSEKDKPKPKPSTPPEASSASGTYGSISQSGNGRKVSTEADEEEQAPLLSSETTVSAEEPRRAKAVRVHVLLACYALLAIWYAAATGVFFSSALFDTHLLGLTATIFALEALLLYRDVNKQRYGTVQRVGKLTVTALLWIVYVLSFLQARQEHQLHLSTVDMSLLSAVSVAVLLVLVDDGWSARLPAVVERRRSSMIQRKISRRALFQMLKPYFWPDSTGAGDTAFWNRIRAILTWICVIGSKVCGLVSPLYLGWATTALAHQDYRMTIIYSVEYSVISLVGTVLKEGQSLVYLKVAQAAFVQLSETAFAHLHSLSLDWHLRKKLGQVLRSMDRGIAACDTLMKYLFLWLLPALVECLTVTVIFAAYFQYLPLALTVFYFVFAYIVWTILLTMWRKKFRKALVQSDNEYHDIFTDSMVNFETVKFFTAEDMEKKRFGEAVMRFQAGSVDVQASLSFLNNTQQVLLKSCLAMALSLAAWGIKQRADCCLATGCDSPISECCQEISSSTCPGMQVGDFVAVLTYTLNLFAPLNFLGSVYNAIVMAIVDLSSMSELLAENPDVIDEPDAIELPKSNETDPDIAVEFDNVKFHYPTQSENKGLKGLSFKMKRGTTTAVVGPTGAGKTTVSRLLFRFYDVLGGAVKINGVDVRSVSQKSLRSAIGVVPQAASMFNETMRYNLKYGKPDATQDELEQAARDSQLLDFIESLEDGWETLVGDRGLKLSGGERQRAAIARCLLKDPPFVLLDEATSALDTITEKSVQDALDRLGEDRTVLVIAHRLGTIRNADNIIVLKDGVAAEQGTHDELLARKGIYADMWNMQLHSTSGSTSRASFSDYNVE